MKIITDGVLRNFLNSNDVPHIALPYNDTIVTRTFTFVVGDQISTSTQILNPDNDNGQDIVPIQSVSEITAIDDWGSNKDFYVDCISIELEHNNLGDELWIDPGRGFTLLLYKKLPPYRYTDLENDYPNGVHLLMFGHTFTENMVRAFPNTNYPNKEYKLNINHFIEPIKFCSDESIAIRLKIDTGDEGNIKISLHGVTIVETPNQNEDTLVFGE